MPDQPKKQLTSTEVTQLRGLLDRAIKEVPAGALREALARQRDELDDTGPTLVVKPTVRVMPGLSGSILRPAPGTPGTSERPGGGIRPPARDDRPTVISPDLRDPPLDIPVDRPRRPIELPPCTQRTMRAANTLASSPNHWWANWGKTHAYVCQRMFFPTNVDELAAAVSRAETDGIPVRAVGGGWSFSEVYLPGNVAMPRLTSAEHVEALAKAVAPALTFPADPNEHVISSVAIPPAAGPADARGTLAMRHPQNGRAAGEWTYLGRGGWSLSDDWDLRTRALESDSWGVFDRLTRDDDFSKASVAFAHGYRPIVGDDRPGSLALFDTRTSWVPNAYYNGNGVWTINIGQARASTRTLRDLVRDDLLEPFHTTLRVRPSTPAWSLFLLLRAQGQVLPQPGYLINTFSLASSLQQDLPDLLSDAALERSAPDAVDRKYYFHVEAGITMAALGELLSRQSPPMAIQATGGSPGATLAGALATGTHGGEHAWPLLIDSVKAVHLVGPGGKQWWIEGTDSIADPDRLMARHPCIDRTRIVAGDARPAGFPAQDWLDAVVVSLGSLGVVYSFVIEVVPQFGIHELIVQSTWSRMLARARLDGNAVTIANLREPPNRERLGDAIFRLLEDGTANGTGIRAEDNRYIDLVLDPNPIVTGGTPDWNCWVLNREVTPTVPFEHKPPPKDLLGRVAGSLGKVLEAKRSRLQEIYGVTFSLETLHNIPNLMANIDRILASSDTIDTALDVLITPFETARAVDVAGPIVSAVFSGLLGVENGRGESTASATQVGAIGFPASGIMGTAIEIALGTRDAFSFLQVEILDRLRRLGTPFFGYVSIRMCPQTSSLLGMQQFAPSVMIEIVGFGTPAARRFVSDVENRTVELMRGGLNAMLHWGLENSALDADALRAIPALNDGSREAPSKLFKFLGIRQAITAERSGDVNVFDNAFTRRLVLG